MINKIDDARLVAFLDGALEPTEYEALASEILNDPELTKRLRALELPFDVAILKQSFEELEKQAPTWEGANASNLVTLDQPAKKTKLGLKPWYWATAACVLMGIGFAGGQFSRQSDRLQSWQSYAAAYHVLYTTETLENAAVDVPASTKIASQFGFDLSSVKDLGPDFQFRRAQMLGFEGKPLLQIAYLANDGQPIAFCLMHDPNQSSDVLSKAMHGIGTLSWQDKAFSYVVLGGEKQQQVDAFFRAVKKRI